MTTRDLNAMNKAELLAALLTEGKRGPRALSSTLAKGIRDRLRKLGHRGGLRSYLAEQR